MSLSGVNIVIVDDSKTFRDILKRYLNMISANIVGEAEDGLQYIELTKKIEADVVLMDLNMPRLNGIETTLITSDCNSKHFKIIALTEHDEIRYMINMKSAGAMGYVVKSEMESHLVRAIETVKNGGTYFPELNNTVAYGK